MDTFKHLRDKTAFDEATRDPIFLLQRRVLILRDLPADFETDGESIWKTDNKLMADSESDERDYVDIEDLPEDYVMEYWETESVFYSRSESEQWARTRSYHYPHGWRVYCVCAEGELARLLDDYAAK